nr:hypothetical protein [uncultured Methanoregula sp.]
MSESTPSTLARLVLFMVCLSIAGSFFAGASWYTVEIQQQKTMPVPKNYEVTQHNNPTQIPIGTPVCQMSIGICIISTPGEVK